MSNNRLQSSMEGQTPLIRRRNREYLFVCLPPTMTFAGKGVRFRDSFLRFLSNAEAQIRVVEQGAKVLLPLIGRGSQETVLTVRDEAGIRRQIAVYTRHS